VRPKLLLADDSVTIQRVIELTFADEDVDVVAVGDGQQAIDRVRTDRPDIVLADVGMPQRDGYEVAAFIKGDPELAHIPVLLLTGAFEPIDEARARAVGCDGVLVKPFEPQMVISRVRDLLAGKRDAPTGSAAPAGAAPAPVDAGGSLEDYFDRLDAALASKGGPAPSLDPVPPAMPPSSVTPKPHLTVAPSVAAVRPLPHADLDLTGWNPSTPEPLETPAPSAPIEQRQPAPSPPSPPPAVVHEPPAVQPKPSAPTPHAVLAPVPPAGPVNPMSAVNPVNAASPVNLEQAFAALLAAEQGLALAPPGHAEPVPRGWPEPVPEAVIEAVVGKVIARMGDETMRAAVLDAAERLVREEIDRIKNAR
jgi:CheY-like chemotaxis protein